MKKVWVRPQTSPLPCSFMAMLNFQTNPFRRGLGAKWILMFHVLDLLKYHDMLLQSEHCVLLHGASVVGGGAPTRREGSCWSGRSLARVNGLVDLTSNGGGARGQTGGEGGASRGRQARKGTTSGDGEADLVDDRMNDLLYKAATCVESATQANVAL